MSLQEIRPYGRPIRLHKVHPFVASWGTTGEKKILMRIIWVFASSSMKTRKIELGEQSTRGEAWLWNDLADQDGRILMLSLQEALRGIGPIQDVLFDRRELEKASGPNEFFVMDGLITMVCGWERKEWNRLLHQESPRRGILEISKIRSFGHQWETEGFDFSGHEHSKTIHRCYTSRSEYDLSMICWFVWSKLINVDQCRYFIKPSFIVSD